MKLYIVVGARPNFMKIAPITRTLKKHEDIEYKVIHTGQHYDNVMSDIFFKGLEIPEPDVNFGMKSTNHASMGMMMSMFEEYCGRERPDIVMVVGDVDSTRGIAIATSKMGIRLAHVEAGLRSGERDLPEEMNRKITDILSDYCFCTTREACKNLYGEGIHQDRVHLTGDVIIEQLWHSLPLAFSDPEPPQDKYALITLHRGYNVDDREKLCKILDELNKIARDIRVIFPIHPRAMSRIYSFGLEDKVDRLDVREPFGYLEMIDYMRKAFLVITDSGGIQIETSVLMIPCLTVRKATERRHTVERGSNVLVEVEKISTTAYRYIDNPPVYNTILDDTGNASERIVQVLKM